MAPKDATAPTSSFPAIPGLGRTLEHHAAPDLSLHLDQLTLFRLLVGRDTPEELCLAEQCKLRPRDMEVLTALFPKARPRF